MTNDEDSNKKEQAQQQEQELIPSSSSNKNNGLLGFNFNDPQTWINIAGTGGLIVGLVVIGKWVWDNYLNKPKQQQQPSTTTVTVPKEVFERNLMAQKMGGKSPEQIYYENLLARQKLIEDRERAARIHNKNSPNFYDQFFISPPPQQQQQQQDNNNDDEINIVDDRPVDNIPSFNIPPPSTRQFNFNNQQQSQNHQQQPPPQQQKQTSFIPNNQMISIESEKINDDELNMYENAQSITDFQNVNENQLPPQFINVGNRDTMLDNAIKEVAAQNNLSPDQIDTTGLENLEVTKEEFENMIKNAKLNK